MKKLIIVGASGMGREVYDMAKNAIGYGVDFEIKGFIDDNVHATDEYPYYPKVISAILDYKIEKDDVFVSSFGEVKFRKQFYDALKAKGAEFYTLVDKNARISPTATLGEGTLVFDCARIGSQTKVGCDTLIQAQAAIGHDVEIGSHSRIDCEAMFVGGVKAGDCVMIHTAAVLNHKVVVEDNATVGACSFVIRRVKEGTTVFGNPAKRLGNF